MAALHSLTSLELDAAWPAKSIESSSTAAPARPWQDRLADLAQLASASLGTDSREANVAPAIHHHLDAIESILRDPRPENTREIGRSRRPSRDRLLSETPNERQGIEHVSSDKSACDEAKKDEKLLPQLQYLLNEVTMFNRELDQRHKESVEIRDLFEERCRGLTRAVAELEDEVVELQAELVEDAIELEGIQGTVHGLQGWIDGLREAQTRAHATRLERSKPRRWGGRKKNDLPQETDAEVVLDGLSAWMRGWRDVEETFQVRADARKSRRERRQEQLSRPEKIEETRPPGTHRRMMECIQDDKITNL